MRLSDWLREKNVTPDRFAAQAGVSGATVRRWCSGARIPWPHNMRRIKDLTGDAVTPNDFVSEDYSSSKCVLPPRGVPRAAA